MTKVKRPKQAGIINEFSKYIERAIDEVDEAAARKRVNARRKANPEATVDELVEMLIKQKCIQTGAIGAVTSSANVIPGIGTVVTLTFGVAADIGMTFKLQAELILEIAAVYERILTDIEKRNAILVITGISTGANQIGEKLAETIAKQVAKLWSREAAEKVAPGVGIAMSATINATTTYIIGERAKAYFSLGAKAVGNWAESVRALTGVDERKISSWLLESTKQSWELINEGGKNVVSAIITTKDATGEIIATQIQHAKELASDTKQNISTGAKATTETIVKSSKKVGESITAGTSTAAEMVSEAGRKLGQNVTLSADKTKEKISDVSGKIKRNKHKKKQRNSPKKPKKVKLFKRHKSQEE